MSSFDPSPAGQSDPQSPQDTSQGKKRWLIIGLVAALVIVIGAVALALMGNDGADSPMPSDTPLATPTATTSEPESTATPSASPSANPTSTSSPKPTARPTATPSPDGLAPTSGTIEVEDYSRDTGQLEVAWRLKGYPAWSHVKIQCFADGKLTLEDTVQVNAKGNSLSLANWCVSGPDASSVTIRDHNGVSVTFS